MNEVSHIIKTSVAVVKPCVTIFYSHLMKMGIFHSVNVLIMYLYMINMPLGLAGKYYHLETFVYTSVP